MSNMLNVVVRLNNNIFKSYRHVSDISPVINNIDFITRDSLYIKNRVSIQNFFGKLAPVGGGLLVIDYDTNLLISYQRSFIAGTIRNGEETPALVALYKAGKIMQDTIDYMIDNRPFRNDFYNCDYKSDGELVMSKLQSIGFTFLEPEFKLWDEWFSNAK